MTSYESTLDPQLTESYRRLHDYLTLKLQKPYTKTKILVMVSEGIQFCARINNITEAQTRDLILHAVKQVLNETDMSQEDKDEIILLVDLIGEEVVDDFIDFAKDIVTFIHKRCPKLCSCCKPAEEAKPTSHDKALRSELGNTMQELEELKTYLRLKMQKPITPAKVLFCIAASVRFIEQFRNLSGSEKKELVIQAIIHIILDSDKLDDSDKDGLVLLVNTFADAFIDLLVMFGNAKIFKDLQNCCSKNCSIL